MGTSSTVFIHVQIVCKYEHLMLYFSKEEFSMPTANKRVHKHFQLDAVKIKRAKKALRAKTETETIERALDFTIMEHERNRLAWQANERFITSGGEIKDVFGKMDR
jgi:hypothetical protein